MALDMVSVPLRFSSGMSPQPYVSHKGVKTNATHGKFSDCCRFWRSLLWKAFILKISWIWLPFGVWDLLGWICDPHADPWESLSEVSAVFSPYMCSLNVFNQYSADQKKLTTTFVSFDCRSRTDKLREQKQLQNEKHNLYKAAKKSWSWLWIHHLLSRCLFISSGCLRDTPTLRVGALPQTGTRFLGGCEVVDVFLRPEGKNGSRRRGFHGFRGLKKNMEGGVLFFLHMAWGWLTDRELQCLRLSISLCQMNKSSKENIFRGWITLLAK